MIATAALGWLLLLQSTAFPDPATDVQPSAELLNWHGWSYASNAGTRSLPAAYAAVGDWKGVQSKASSNGTAWRTKVVVLTSVGILDRTPDGLTHERRWTLESVQLQQALSAIKRFAAFASVETGGQAQVVPDVDIERDTLWENADPSLSAFDAGFVQQYLAPRINGGVYEAEDKVYRGPYNSVFLILPSSGSVGAITSVNGTPVTTVSFVDGVSGVTPGILEKNLDLAWKLQVAARAKSAGYSQVLLGAGPSASEWAEVASLGGVPTETLLKNLAAKSAANLFGSEESVPVSSSYHSSETQATLVNDSEKGQVLVYSEKGVCRSGGLSLAEPLISVKATPTLSFSAKSGSRDGLAICVSFQNKRRGFVSLGRDVPAPSSGGSDEPVIEAPFVADGQWHHVSIDLSLLAKKVDSSDVSGLRLEPTPNMRISPRIQLEPIEYRFDEFKVSSDKADDPLAPRSANADSTDVEERALAVIELAKQPSPNSELIKLLKDPADMVRLNALAVFQKQKDPSAEAALIEDSISINPAVSSAAVMALGNQGSATATAAVRKVLNYSLSEHTKAAAASVMGASKDLKVVGDILDLAEARSWSARCEAVSALTQIPDPVAGLARITFIAQKEAAVRLVVIRNSNPKDEDQMRKLLWYSVNDPYDAVRAAANIQLIQSPVENLRSEGYKGVRDDSVWVRREFLQYLADHPSEANRGALRIAVTDRSSVVRADALRAFAALDKGVGPDEIANVLEDKDPEVQLALLQLSKKRGLALPAKTMELVNASPDPRVLEAARG